MLDDATRETLSVVKHMGSLGLLHTENGERVKSREISSLASEAAHAIADMDKHIINLSTFFISTVESDDSYESIEYSILNANGMRSGTLVKTIYYKDTDLVPRAAKVEYGPLFPMAIAEAFLAMLNEHKKPVSKSVPPHDHDVTGE